MRFSVLMSVYAKERAEYLYESIESIIKQTYLPSEIVIVKDGILTDKLNKVINKYLSKYGNLFKIVELKENVGLGQALNIGVKNCSYELIARMDSDDICRKDRFEKQIKVFSEDSDIDIVGSYITEFTEKNKEIKKIRTVPLKHDDIVKYSKRRNPLNHVTVMYKKSSVISCGNYQECFLSEDYQLWVKMLSNGYKSINIPESLVFVRCDDMTYERRGGIKYIKAEYMLQKEFLSLKYITFQDFFINMTIRATVRALPNCIRKFIYKSLLRLDVNSNVNKEAT